MLPLMETPLHVRDLATACVASVQATTGVTLDFTPDTLSVLDHYVREILESPEEELISLVAPMCGAYFGEVVKRQIEGARWHAPKDTHADWRVELAPVFFYFPPVGMALDVIAQAESALPSSIEVAPQDREAVEASVALYGDVREQDYFRFAVRYEVIEQAALAAIRAAAARDQTRVFETADYDRFVAEKRAAAASLLH